MKDDAVKDDAVKDDAAPELSRREFARWMWRQLTSMKTALLLLLLLAVAAVPGSIWPQQGVDARAVEAYRLEHPDLAPWLDRLGAFHVYTSPWFSAVYLLLMTSLIGCIIPRTAVYARALRARPPKAPRNFARMPASGRFETDASVEEVLAAGRAVLRGRVDVDVASGELRAEKGFLREAGNLLFHVSVVVVLIGTAIGALWSYRGAAIVTEGDSFGNVLTQYDDFSAGALFDPETLPGFSLDLAQVDAEFNLDGPTRGSPKLFRAAGLYDDGDVVRPFSIEVNHPLEVDGTSVFLVGQGYAPVIKVTDAEGNVVFEDAVPFLPEDATYTSTGVVKVPDASPEQLGLQGFFLPTAVSVGDEEAPISAFPAAANARLGLFAYHGDLGLDAGTPQSVYILDKAKLTQFMLEDGKPLRAFLAEGQKATLPDGSTIEFTDLRQFARFQIASTPFVELPLLGVWGAILGLLLSLFVRPRRTWIRARHDGSRTVVEIAALDRVPRDDLPTDLQDLVARLEAELS